MGVRNDNYAIQAMQAKARFLRYDQEELIHRCHLEADGEYLYLTFLSRPYRICRRSGHMEQKREGNWVDGNSFSEVMTILDWLCDSAPQRCISGRWCNIVSRSGFHRALQEKEDPYAGIFAAEPEAFAAACEAMGGIRMPAGDVGYAIELVDGLRVYIQLWQGDEEFPPRLRCLWDENVLDYLRYETTWYASALVLERLREHMGGMEHGHWAK